MDIWSIIDIAQHWKKSKSDILNSPTENDVLTLSESSPVGQQVLEKKCTFRGVLSGKKEEKCVCPDIDISEEAIINTFLRETLSLGNLSYNIQHGERFSDDIPQTHEDYALQPSKEVCLCCSPVTSTSALRAHRLKGTAFKPLTSLESCLMAQMYNERACTDDYVLDSVYSPRTPTNSPFVARGRSCRTSSRGEGGLLKFPVEIMEKPPARNFTYSKEELITGIPHLLRLGDLNLQKRSSRQTERSNNSSTTTNGKHPNIKGLPQGVFLFCLGLSAGIVSSFLANQQEVDKLNQLLRQKNNLVEDLQDELEMKDLLTVKELAVEDDESQDTHHDSLYYGSSCSPEPKLDISVEHDQGKYHDDEAEVKSLSRIEAELEAELERLELSINTCSLEGKLSNLVEQLEPDFLPDVAVGELKADSFSRQTGGQAYADHDGGGNSTTYPSDYAVSPRELSLRLHEVIESRLEARVKELEAELQNSQWKFQLAKYDQIESWRKFPSSDDPSSSNPASPVHENEPPCASHPVVINLPDEAQETNEANDLFSMLNDSEDDIPHGIINSSRGTSSRPCELSLCQARKEGCMESNIDRFVEEETYNTMSYDLSSSRESDGDSEDEIEKILIQHIVERARKQGSSVILDAQKALFSGNEDGQ